MLRRSGTRIAALAALLGLLTTLGLAALCAWRGRQFAYGPADVWAQRLTDPRGVEVQEASGQAPPETLYLEFQLYHKFGATFGTSRLRPFQNYTPAAPPPVRTGPDRIASRWQRAELLPWLDRRRPWPNPATGENIWVKTSGWPLRCFVCNLSRTNAPGLGSHTWSARGGVILSTPTFPGWADWPPSFPHIIPLRPMWPELLANASAFGAAWGALFWGVAAIRRRRRARRGLCAACGYDLRGTSAGSRCPECGRPSPAGAPADR